jgi:large subunit ribosomal protein L18
MKPREAKIQKVGYRRKREGKTNYKKRLKLLLSSKARLVVRPSLRMISCQIVEYYPEGDKVIVSASSKELDKFGWKYSKGNISSAYLTGLILGKKAKAKKVKEAILDAGLFTLTKGSKIYACLKGVADSGVNVPYSAEVVPSEDRIKGKHVADYASKLKADKGKYEKQFSENIKNNADPLKIVETFEKIKKNIISGEN